MRSLPHKTPPARLVAPWVWGCLIASLLLLMAILLLVNQRPTLLPTELVNPSVLRPLPPIFQFPDQNGEQWLPLAITLGAAVALTKIPVNNWTRSLVRMVVVLVGVRYLVWRFTTLNFLHWTSTIVSCIFFANELIYSLVYFLYLIQTAWTTEAQRRWQADHYQQAVLLGDYTPSVDVFIPTYDEPAAMLQRTVVACQAMTYKHKTIYILDDGHRAEIKALAQKLGCEYIDRPDNSHRKAGNLNHALALTRGELITVIDADFIPFPNFLDRTVGFFQNPRYDLLQTPQHFYNPDYHATNLGLEYILPSDLEHFFGLVQPGRDLGNGVICCGTSYVVRRKAIESVGGYYTACVVEDFQTGTLMQTRGMRLIYLNEILSIGESPRNFKDYIEQRLRWLQGNMQIYYCSQEIPLWTRLNWVQKSYHINQIFHNFSPFSRAIYLTFPLLSFALGMTPMVASVNEFIFYAIPYTFINIATASWATENRYSTLWAEVYDSLYCYPAVRHLVLILRNPFGKLSTLATPKGSSLERKRYNLNYTWPLLVLVIVSVVFLTIHYCGPALGLWIPTRLDRDGTQVTVSWVVYNLVIAVIALLAAVDQPTERRASDRFPVETVCRIEVNQQSFWGYTQEMSEQGVRLSLKTAERFATQEPPVQLEFVEYGLSLTARIRRQTIQNHGYWVSLEFEDVTVEQQRLLVDLLYGRRAWWHFPRRTGGIDAVLAMLARFFDFRPLLIQPPIPKK